MEATATPTESTTPVSTPETSPAAPATSAPSPAPTTSQRPTSMLDALEKEAAKHDAAQTPPVAATTVQPSAPPVPAITPAREPGPIPFKDHKTALDNARAKAVAEWRQQYGWAEQFPQEKLQRFTQIADRINTDPIGHIADLIAELQGHQTYGPQLRSQAARLLAGARGTPAIDLSPDVQVVNEHGQVTGQTYSADRVKAIVEHAVQDAIGKEIAPLKQESAQRQQERQVQQHRAQAVQTAKQIEATADSQIAEVRDILDGNDTLFPEVQKLMAQYPKFSPHAAALAVRKTHILPTLKDKAQADALDTMKKKAAGNTANGASAAGTPVKPRTREELRAWMAARAPR